MREHPDLFTDADQAIAYILEHPDSVHENPGDTNQFYLIICGEALRTAGLLRSRRTRLLDVVVERHVVQGGSYWRLFHCAPTLRNRGGRQLWP